MNLQTALKEIEQNLQKPQGLDYMDATDYLEYASIKTVQRYDNEKANELINDLEQLGIKAQKMQFEENRPEGAYRISIELHRSKFASIQEVFSDDEVEPYYT